jgi:hypothetical protein
MQILKLKLAQRVFETRNDTKNDEYSDTYVKQSREMGNLTSIEARNEGWMLQKNMTTVNPDRIKYLIFENAGSHESN